jgi:tetratricopeptide (TPR) repeat protein
MQKRRIVKEGHFDYNETMNRIFRKNHSALLFLALLFCACASRTNIRDDLTPAEIVQRAQEASDHNRYNTALRYYEVLLERYQYNMELVCTAEYEIALIHYKQKKYKDSRAELNALLERYDGPDGELLPHQFKRLAYIVLDRITEKETPKFPFTLFKKKGQTP